MIVIIPLIVVCVLLIIYKSYKEKFKLLNTRIHNIEEKLNSTLIKRRELIKDSEEVIKDVIKTKKEVYEGITKLNDSNLSMIELDRKLIVYINEFHLIEDRYKKLRSDKRFQKIYFSINETEDLLNAYKNYYNKTSEEYNKLINKFPIIILAKLKRKKQKLFFDE